LNQITLGLYFLGEYEAAIEATNRAIRSYPDFPNTYRWLAAALGQVGRTEAGKEALKKAIAIAPTSFDMYVRQRVPWVRPEDHAHARGPAQGWVGGLTDQICHKVPPTDLAITG
jgi:adenylate cyclase